jgi:hypothetical protein
MQAVIAVLVGVVLAVVLAAGVVAVHENIVTRTAHGTLVTYGDR